MDLRRWWSTNVRSFQWRRTRDPYEVLLAEVLLHRTRADQVAPVYQNLLEQFPTLAALAAAGPEELRTRLRSLGLSWRVDLLHLMAQDLVERFGGSIPVEEEALLSLPGVGPYIAAAVRCFAFGLPDPILDTNTVRVASRLYGVPATDASRRSRRFRELLGRLMDPEHPREHNFALLDHAALTCTPRDPKCPQCPVSQHCAYGQSRLAGGRSPTTTTS